MTRIVWALCALVLVFVLTACEGQATFQSSPAGTATAATSADTADGVLSQLETELLEITRNRDVRQGWAAEVRPGDYRETRYITEGIRKLAVIDEQLAVLPTSDKVGVLRSEIRLLMLQDSKLLLQKARIEKDIDALDDFLEFTQDLDVEPKQEFGIDAAGLRAEALVMAKAYVTKYRPFNSDTSAGVDAIIREWQFTPQEIGLTAAEMKELEQ